MNLLNKIRKLNCINNFFQLLFIIKNDAEIRDQVIQLLKLDSFQHRNVLNRWMEQLRRNNAAENLRQSLSYLFDDTVAEKTLTLLRN